MIISALGKSINQLSDPKFKKVFIKAVILCIAFIGWAVFGQTLDTPAMLGLGLIITGTVIIQLFSTTSH